MAKVNKDLFTETIKEIIYDLGYIPEEMTVEKNNVFYHGIIAKTEKENKNNAIYPVINIDQLYAEFDEESCPLYNLKERLKGELLNIINYKPALDLEEFLKETNDWNFVKERLFVSAVNPSKNEEFLKKCIHTTMYDMCVVPRILVDANRAEEMFASIVIYENMISEWGKTKEEIIEAAIKNSEKLFPMKLSPLEDVAFEAFQKSLGIQDADVEDEAIFSGVLKDTIRNILDGVIVTTEDGVYGCGTIFYPNTMKEIYEKLNHKTFAIIPFSVHHAFAVTKDSLKKRDNVLFLKQLGVRLNEYFGDIEADDFIEPCVLVYNGKDPLYKCC